MQKRSIPYQAMVFVCTGDSCKENGAAVLAKKLKASVKSGGFKSKMRVCQSGCMNACDDGPNLAIFPDGLLFSDVKRKDADAIIDAAKKAGAID